MRITKIGKILLWGTKPVIWIGISAIVVLKYFAYVLVSGMFLLGLSDCSLSDTLSAASWKNRIFAEEGNIRTPARLLGRMDGLVHWTTPHGEYWIPEGPNNVLADLAEVVAGAYGTGALGVRPGDVVIDCGAAVGTFTRHALNSGARLVIAVEPASANVKALKQTFHREIGEGRVIVYPKGVSDQEGRLPLYGASIRADLATSDRTAAEMILLTTIDHAVAEMNVNCVDFIKMDIEGAEKQALNGARNTLLRFKPRLAVSTEHFPDDGATIPQTVRNLVSSYTSECGPCFYFKGRIRPYVIHFR